MVVEVKWKTAVFAQCIDCVVRGPTLGLNVPRGPRGSRKRSSERTEIEESEGINQTHMLASFSTN